MVWIAFLIFCFVALGASARLSWRAKQAFLLLIIGATLSVVAVGLRGAG